ncbi:MAG: App1 family protein [Calditrichia bacterium]
MINWFSIIQRVAAGADSSLDNLYRRFFTPGSLQVLPFRGYANQQTAFLKGRVLEPKQYGEADKNASTLRNLQDMFNRLESDELAFCPVEIRFNDQTFQVQADEEGYVSIELPLADTETYGWLEATLSIPASASPSGKRIDSIGSILQPHPETPLGVISDLDDTILKSYVQNPLKLATELLLKNAATRKAFEGASDLYQKLHVGKDNALPRPMFYLSSSPWNIYDFLCEFLALNQLPIGPLFLKDYGFDTDKFFSGGHNKHKLSNIKKLAEAYPKMSFILIGDSTQRDAEIYTLAAEKFSRRIAAIYIRDVANKHDSSEFRQYKDRCAAEGVEFMPFQHSSEVEAHAVKKGWI